MRWFFICWFAMIVLLIANPLIIIFKTIIGAILAPVVFIASFLLHCVGAEKISKDLMRRYNNDYIDVFKEKE